MRAARPPRNSAPVDSAAYPGNVELATDHFFSNEIINEALSQYLGGMDGRLLAR